MPRRTRHHVEVDQAQSDLSMAMNEISKKYNLSAMEFVHILHETARREINLILKDEAREK